MTTQKNIEVVLRSRLEGGDKTARDAKKTTDAMRLPPDAVKNFSAVEKAALKSVSVMARLGQQVTALNRALASKEGVSSLNDQRRAIEGMGSALDRVIEKQERLSAIEDARREKQRGRSASGFRGFVQGMGLGEYFPEDDRPGILRNVAGRIAGSAVARAGAAGMSLATSPFTGAQGLLGAVGAIPFVGQGLAGLTQQGLASGQAGLAYSRARMGMAQFGLVPGAGGLDAREEALRRYPIPERPPPVGAAGQEQVVSGSEGVFGGLVAYGRERLRSAVTGEEMRPAAEAMQASAQRAQDEDYDRRVKQAEVKREQFEARMANDQREGAIAGMREIAGALGGIADPTQQLQAASQFLGSAGLSVQGYNARSANQEAFTAAMAAQTMGVDLDVTGRIQRGARIHAGVRGGGAEAIERFWEQAKQLNLSGPDAQRYLAVIADKVTQFEQTGIPVAQESLFNLQKGLAPIVGANRAMAIAGGIQSFTQQMGMGAGPTSATDFLAFQTLGGWKGGGAEEFFRAKQRMESGDISGLPDMLSRITEQTAGIRGGKFAGALTLQNILRERGMGVQSGEALNILEGRTNPDFMREMQEGAFNLGEFRKGGGLVGAARRATPEEVGREVKMAEEARAVSMQMIKPMQDLSQVSQNMLSNFGLFSKELGTVTGMIKSASEDAQGWFDRLRTLITTLEGKAAAL